MPQNRSLYAAPPFGALLGVLALLLDRPEAVVVIFFLTIGFVAGWFVLAYRFQYALLVVEDTQDTHPPAGGVVSKASLQPGFDQA